MGMGRREKGTHGKYQGRAGHVIVIASLCFLQLGNRKRNNTKTVLFFVLLWCGGVLSCPQHRGERSVVFVLCFAVSHWTMLSSRVFWAKTWAFNTN